MSATRAHRARLHRGSWGKPRVELWSAVSHHQPLERQHEAQAAAADGFLRNMSDRLNREYGIRETTVRALAVSAFWLRARPDNDDEDEPEPKPMRRCGHHLGGGRLV